MAQIRTFQDLIVWQKSHQLVLTIYNITDTYPTAEKFGLISQMRRAAVSIPCNIVEGFRRRTIKDGLNFYNIAQSSLEELRYQVILSLDLGFINGLQSNSINQQLEEVSKMLYAWINSNKKIV